MASALSRRMAGARDFTELEAYQLAEEVRLEIVELVRQPSFASAPDLKSQLLRAADSASSNIAEGFSRYMPRDFGRFLRVSRGSLSEIITRLGAGVDRKVVSKIDADRIRPKARRARAACAGLIRYLETATPPGMPEPKKRKKNPQG